MSDKVYICKLFWGFLVVVEIVNETVRNRRSLTEKIPDPSDGSTVLMTVQSRTIPPGQGPRFGNAQCRSTRKRLMMASVRPSHWNSVGFHGVRMDFRTSLVGIDDTGLSLVPHIPKTGDGTPPPPPSMVCVEFFQNLMTPCRRRGLEFRNIDEASLSENPF